MNKKSPRFYYKGNQLKQLRAFCAVAKSGKMTDAAEELFLSQPAISLQIRALERELDTVLFERHGPRISTPGSRVAVWVVPTDEETMIARHVARLLR